MSTIFLSQWEGATILDNAVWSSEQQTAGALSVATDQVLQSAQSLKFDRNSNTRDYLLKNSGVGSNATCGIRFAIRINTVVAAVLGVVVISGAGNDCVVFRIDGSSGTLIAYNVLGNANIGTGFTYSLDTWYQVEFIFVSGTSIKWKIWDASGTSLVSAEQTTTTSVRTANVDAVGCGVYLGTFSGSNIFWFDSFVADNAAYPGPFISGNSLKKVLLETIGIIDIVGRSFRFVKKLVESIGITDNAQNKIFRFILKIKVESIGIAENIRKTFKFNRSVSDLISIAEGIRLVRRMNRIFTEVVNISDLVIRSFKFNRIKIEAINISENVKRYVYRLIKKIIVESIGIAENIRSKLAGILLTIESTIQTFHFDSLARAFKFDNLMRTFKFDNAVRKVTAYFQDHIFKGGK